MVPFAGGNVHKGFLDQYLAIQDELISKTAAYIEKFKPEKILITGHSLGGALANLCAVDFFDRLETKERSKIRCITFGAPKPGDAMFCAVFRENVPNSHRLVLPYDPIPKVRIPKSCWEKFQFFPVFLSQHSNPSTQFLGPLPCCIFF